MKKIALLISVVVFLSGCAITDMFIDEVDVHNGLVKAVDSVRIAEEIFYDNYWILEDNGETDIFLDSYSKFDDAAKELFHYMEITKFSSEQELIVADFKEYYRPILSGYTDYAGKFADEVEENGYTYESVETYFEMLDKFTVQFVDANNRFSTTINGAKYSNPNSSLSDNLLY